MRRTIVGTFLTAALVAGPAAATAAAQAPVADQTAAVQVLAQENRDNDDDNGGWGLWGLAGLLGLLGLIPRRSKSHGTNPRGTSPGTGGGAHPTDRI
ncbi:hypothetical protein M4914_19190 [Streptomyces somaliensis DSM 40738]|uniref:MYXO-CTERM domain-containing protein n=1 Tax=Streptomyces somaliensis (strain ATCC 33201 / DSM 40738 / JCM 12659 / KCTC 9044 / NCTC 11332 / NRRL B-12077 / IP 733) TaxID=1134445 RepID=A0AA44DH58_STRE0|nr:MULTISPECIES: WGxxGxxG family protein [Streptomyces]MCQ0024863.1 hypothetical protein [Streptomyces somaliensis DSM 40738]NKY16454.1 hypothetical protein [Streptomyces somaliensis DSM 40738]URM90785.1 hypothetical protein LUW75_13185 [Streptomyces sp. MRC013]